MESDKYYCTIHGVTDRVIKFTAPVSDTFPEIDEVFCLDCLIDMLHYTLEPLEKVED